jgi:hypothetical protein
MNSTVIDTNNGELRIGEMRIPATACFDEVLRLAPESEVQARGEYKEASFYDVFMEGKYFTFSLGFYQARLYETVVVFYQGKKPTWDDWSEEKQLRDRKGYEQWLDETLGKNKRQFAWGRIVTFYEYRSGGAGISIRYGKMYRRATLARKG